jgi:hypothetical protein
MRRIITAVCVLLVGTGYASAAIVTSCGAPEGYTYFDRGDLVPKAEAGWTKDKISAGRYILMREKEDFDIVYMDAAKRTVSSKEDGANIIKVTEKPGTVVLILNYPGTNIETWVFKIDGKGEGSVMVSQQRYGDSAPIVKYSLMRAVCSK